MESYPKIKHVQTMAGKKLLVTFSNHTKKSYDCSSLGVNLYISQLGV
jgi:hypothetical protein